MVTEHSHKKDCQISAAISKKKRKKIAFFSKISENILKTKKNIKKTEPRKFKQQKINALKKTKRKNEKMIKQKKRKNKKKITTKSNKTKKMQKTKNKTKKIKPFTNIATRKAVLK